MRFLTGFIAAVLLIAILGLGIVYSGAYNIAASAPHTAAGKWLLHTTKHNSIERRADTGEVPPSFTPQQVRRGALEFAESCVDCHGGPGAEPTDWAKGLRPDPPDLEKIVEHWNDEQLAWIIEHGIKMTGMPAFGKSHGEEEIWAVVAFLHELPGMTPERFRQLAGKSDRAAAAGGGS